MSENPLTPIIKRRLRIEARIEKANQELRSLRRECSHPRKYREVRWPWSIFSTTEWVCPDCGNRDLIAFE